MKITLLCLVLISLSVSQPAFGGLWSKVKVGLHLQPRTSRGACGQALSEFGCDEISETSLLRTQGKILTPYDMYIVLLDIPPSIGLLGIEFGIQYNGVGGEGLDPFGIQVCADMEFSGLGWPNSGGAATYTWVDCQNTIDPSDPQREAMAIAASIYVYAYNSDIACITQKPSGILGATDCAANSYDLTILFPLNAGCVGFGGNRGYHPCNRILSPVTETTWGAIKRQFR